MRIIAWYCKCWFVLFWCLFIITFSQACRRVTLDFKSSRSSSSVFGDVQNSNCTCPGFSHASVSTTDNKLETSPTVGKYLFTASEVRNMKNANIAGDSLSYSCCSRPVSQLQQRTEMSSTQQQYMCTYSLCTKTVQYSVVNNVFKSNLVKDRIAHFITPRGGKWTHPILTPI